MLSSRGREKESWRSKSQGTVSKSERNSHRSEHERVSQQEQEQVKDKSSERKSAEAKGDGVRDRRGVMVSKQEQRNHRQHVSE